MGWCDAMQCATVMSYLFHNRVVIDALIKRKKKKKDNDGGEQYCTAVDIAYNTCREEGRV
jgi:hypothetical protein